ncbi:hypothetical protein OSB04_024246 [Centaurea solstitialis]|uniref:Uncharacterized protein n=1 Tax=Centaurea solstitialis TaxID=347529 RepID=A0AA38SME8_9ASTR|nr:hypothetical protein OSB04_024246 [Centaurea solstitialis]
MFVSSVYINPISRNAKPKISWIICNFRKSVIYRSPRFRVCRMTNLEKRWKASKRRTGNWEGILDHIGPRLILDNFGRSPTAKACSPGSKPPYLQNASPRARTQYNARIKLWKHSQTMEGIHNYGIVIIKPSPAITRKPSLHRQPSPSRTSTTQNHHPEPPPKITIQNHRPKPPSRTTTVTVQTNHPLPPSLLTAGARKKVRGSMLARQILELVQMKLVGLKIKIGVQVRRAAEIWNLGLRKDGFCFKDTENGMLHCAFFFIHSEEVLDNHWIHGCIFFGDLWIAILGRFIGSRWSQFDRDMKWVQIRVSIIDGDDIRGRRSNLVCFFWFLGNGDIIFWWRSMIFILAVEILIGGDDNGDRLDKLKVGDYMADLRNVRDAYGDRFLFCSRKIGGILQLNGELIRISHLEGIFYWANDGRLGLHGGHLSFVDGIEVKVEYDVKVFPGFRPLFPKKKKVRGYTQKAETWKMKSNQKIVVTFNTFGKPVGEEGNELVQYIGTLVRMPNHVLNCIYGLEKGSHRKERRFSKFVIHPIETNEIKKWIFGNMGK